MALTWNEANEMVEDARLTLRRVDQMVKSMAVLCSNRLMSSHVDDYTLRELKKELKRYNMHTGRWSE